VAAPDGKFLAKVLVDLARLPKDYPKPSPGMTCKVKLVAYTNDNALTLPKAVVHTDSQRDDQDYVWVSSEEGKPTRRDVTVGRRNNATVEITAGIQVGDKILQQAPKEDA
jgi:multidrug efflux pump subunit AcrA (membrane-fusion protein)